MSFYSPKGGRRRPISLRSGVSRRDFLQTLAMAAGTVAVGCGNGGEDYVVTNAGGLPTGSNPGNDSNPPGNNPPPGGGGAGGGIAVQGSVNLAEIGGSNLTVQTVHQLFAPVASDGSFTSMTSGVGVQMLWITEPPAVQAQGITSRAVRALAMFLPGGGLLRVGAESTAVALLFLSYGVLTTEPDEALRRVLKLKTLASFQPFVDFLLAQLPVRSLVELANDATLQALRQACVDEFRDSEQPPVLSRLSDEDFVRQGGIQWTRLEGADSEGRKGVKFENGGYRFVSIIRQEIAADGTDATPPTKVTLSSVTQNGSSPNLLNGANGISWGNLITRQVGTRASAEYRFKPDHRTRRTRYWCLAPGRGREALPAGISESDFGTGAYAWTTLVYFVLPLLDMFSGGLAGSAFMRSLTSVEPEVITASTALRDLVGRALDSTAVGTGSQQLGANLISGSVDSISSSFIDLMFAILGGMLSLGGGVTTLLAELGAASGVAGAGATATVLAGTIEILVVALGAAGFLFGLLNLGMLIGTLLRLPQIFHLEVEEARFSWLEYVSHTFRTVDNDGEVLYLTYVDGSEQYRLHRPPVGGIEISEETFLGVSEQERLILLAANNSKQVAGRTLYDRSPPVGPDDPSPGDPRNLVFRILRNGASKVQETRILDESSLFTATSNHTPTAMNDSGDVVGTYVKKEDIPDTAGGQPLTIFYTDVWWSDGGPPQRLNVGSMLHAALRGQVRSDLRFNVTPVAINKGYQVLCFFSISRVCSGVVVLNLVGNSIRIIEFEPDDGTTFARTVTYHTGQLNERGEFCFTRDFIAGNNSFVSVRWLADDNGRVESRSASSGLYATAMDEVGTVGGFVSYSDPEKPNGRHIEAYLWNRSGSLDSLQQSIQAARPDVDGPVQTRILALSDKGHILGSLSGTSGGAPAELDFLLVPGSAPAGS